MGKKLTTQEEYDALQQGTKVLYRIRFGCFDQVEGRIEKSKFGQSYIVAEHNYHGHPDILESMRFYNRLIEFTYEWVEVIE